MTYQRRISTYHYMEYEGPGWAVTIYSLTGQALWPLKSKLIYKGTKADIERRKSHRWWKLWQD